MNGRLHRKVLVHARKVEKCSRLRSERLTAKDSIMVHVSDQTKAQAEWSQWVNGSDVEKM